MIIPTDKIVTVNRPDHINYFLGLALLVSKRSTDSQTQHGCVITSLDNRILGTGYNGLPRDVDISLFPNVRPDKYEWMTHSEDNCITNCVVKPKDAGGGIAYVTGRCCLKCTQLLWQNHVCDIYQIDAHGWFANDKDQEHDKKEYLVAATNGKLKLHYIKPDLEWMKNLS